VPIYEYVCSACHHRTDILRGINDAGPAFCPSCGAEGTMRKAFAVPTIHFKGTGWAKKERATGNRTKAAAAGESGGDKTGQSESAADTPAKAESGTKASSSDSTDDGS
jgi:putative FmdB family regulatory protein